MELISSVLFAGFLVYVFFGIYLYRLNPAAVPNRLSLVVCSCFAFWALTYAVMHSVEVMENIWPWYRLSTIGSILFTSTIVHFFLSVTGKSAEYRTRLRALIYIMIYLPAAYFVYSSASGRFGAVDFVQKHNAWIEVYNFASPVFLAYNSWIFAMMGLCFVLIVLWERKAGDVKKIKQARTILAYGVAALLFAMTANILFPLLEFRLPSLGIMFALIWTFGIGHAVSRYGFLRVTPEIALDPVLKSLMDIIILTDEDGNISWANRAAVEVTGYSLEELKNLSMGALLEKNGFPCHEPGHESAAGEGRITSKNGDSLPVLINTASVRRSEEDIGFVFSLRDVSPIKKSEEAYKQLNREREFLLDNISTHIWYMKDEKTYGFSNRAHLEFLGLNIEEVRGRSLFELLSEETARNILESNKKAFNQKGKLLVEQWMYDYRGERRLFGIAIQPILDEKGSVISLLCTAADITDKKIAEEKILESIKIKSDFISLISHELRTPLSIIREGISILHNGAAGLVNTRQNKILSSVDRNIERLSKLISDILDFQKLEGRKMKLLPGSYNINHAVVEAVETLAESAERKGIVLNNELDDSIPGADFDRDKIIQVLVNLIENAIKFTDEGTVSIGTRRNDAGEIEVIVADTGKGIESSEADRIFNVFEQVGGISQRKYGGFGLGLSIAKQIVELHGGKIWAEPNPEGGANFIFTLPCAALPVRPET